MNISGISVKSELYLKKGPFLMQGPKCKDNKILGNKVWGSEMRCPSVTVHSYRNLEERWWKVLYMG